MKTRNKIIGRVYILLTTILVFIAYVPIDNMIVNKDKIHIINCANVIRPGDKLNYRFPYYKFLPICGTIVKSLEINGKYIVATAPQIGNLKSGKHAVAGFFIIPDTDFVIGKAKFTIYIEYSLFGGMRVLRDKLESDIFTIQR